MNIEYVHASKFGNGVADEFKKARGRQGRDRHVHHIRDTRPDRLAPADLYVFSSLGRVGKPIGGMRRFLKEGDAAGRHPVRALHDRGGTAAGQRRREGFPPKRSWRSGSASARS